MFLKRFKPYFNYLKPVKVQFGVGLLAGLIYAASSGFGLPYVTKHLVPLVTQPDKPEAAFAAGEGGSDDEILDTDENLTDAAKKCL